jgi:predicted nucleic acid-binding protein
MNFVDTNILIRYLVAPEPGNAADIKQAAFSRALLERVQRGEESVTASDVVVAEACFVLSSPKRYNLSYPDVAARLRPIFSLRGFKLGNKQTVLRALDLYSQYDFLDIEDCLIASSMEQRGIRSLYSFDSDFDTLPEFQAGKLARLPKKANKP